MSTLEIYKCKLIMIKICKRKINNSNSNSNNNNLCPTKKTKNI